MVKTANNRIVYLDVLRVLAIFMVIIVHAGDIYLYNSDQHTFGSECSFFAVALRANVPLFIIMSSILLLPLKTNGSQFLKRRFTRVIIPFLLWSIAYVFLPVPNNIAFGGPANTFTGSDINVYLYNLMMIPFNFTGSNVHFWFIYVIIGLYLIMPVLSPWFKTASKKAFVFFLFLWSLTLFFPYIRLWFPEIQGECDWNNFGMLYYFGGYIGYVVLGYFLHHHNTLTSKPSLVAGFVLYISGAIITYWGFISDQKAFIDTILNNNVENWKLIEFSINFLSPGVAAMTAGIIMIFQKINISAKTHTIIKELSIKSYGIFLVHYILVLWIGPWIKSSLSINNGVEQILIAIVTFLVSYGIVKVLSFLPKSKYIIG